MKLKLKTKEEKHLLVKLKVERLSEWHDWFAWYPVWWDGGFAWLSTIQRRLIIKWNCDKHDNNNTYYCSCLYMEKHKAYKHKSEYKFLNTLTVKDR